MLNMEEKEKFLADVERAARDKQVQEDLRLEDNIEYRFALVEEDAFERGKNQGIEQGIEQGIAQGIEQNTLNIIEEMLKKNMNLKDISDITNKSIDEINKIKHSLKD